MRQQIGLVARRSSTLPMIAMLYSSFVGGTPPVTLCAVDERRHPARSLAETLKLSRRKMADEVRQSLNQHHLTSPAASK
jgi:hypothetical protein